MTAREGSIHTEEKVRVLQRKLYRAAKAHPQRTFGVLHDKVCATEVLRTGWERVRRNRGSAGVDGETIAAIETYGVDRLLGELQEDLRRGRYRPQPVRRVFIPKPDGRQRPLGIPRVQDRIVQAAVRLVIEPLFEASFRVRSFGFRPKRNAKQAADAIRFAVNQRRRIDVIDLDLKSYFDTIDHQLLMGLVRRRVRDPRVLRLIKGWLRAGVMQEGKRHETLLGTPQGGVISPLLANIYLHPLDVYWEREMPSSTMVRYADDLVVLCRMGEAKTAMPVLRHFLGRLKLTVNEEKTCIRTAREGFDFLGIHFRQKTSRYDARRSWCYAWPSRRSVQRVRDKIRTVVRHEGWQPSLAEMVKRLNPIVRGWGNYFRPFDSWEQFRGVDYFVWHRLRRWLRRKHGNSGSFRRPNQFLDETKAGLHVLSRSARAC